MSRTMCVRHCRPFARNMNSALAGPKPRPARPNRKTVALQQHCQTLTAQNNRLSGQNAALAGSDSTYSRQKSLDAQVSALQERNHSLNDQVAVLRLKNS